MGDRASAWESVRSPTRPLTQKNFNFYSNPSIGRVRGRVSTRPLAQKNFNFYPNPLIGRVRGRVSTRPLAHSPRRILISTPTPRSGECVGECPLSHSPRRILISTPPLDRASAWDCVLNSAKRANQREDVCAKSWALPSSIYIKSLRLRRMADNPKSAIRRQVRILNSTGHSGNQN